MKQMKKTLALLLALVMLAGLFALCANAYSSLPANNAYLVKTGETVDMEAFYKANRYGSSGAYQFYNLKSVTITSKGTTYASVSGKKVKFPQGGKAVVKLDAQYLVASTGKIVDDPVSYAFYACSSTKYIVIFEPNGGSGDASIYADNKTIYKGNQPHFTRTGYTLDGWADTPGASQAAYTSNITAVEKSPMILYAHWKPNTYTLYFNANGGTVSQTSKSVAYGGTFGTLPTPTRAGYKFDGWYGSATGGGQFTSSSPYSFTQNLTVYAHWTKLTEVKTITITGVTAPVVGAAPVKTGYKVSSGVTVKSCNWTENIYGDTYATTSDTKFQSGKKYAVSFEIKPADGYAFVSASSMSATINGKTAEFTNPSTGVYYVRYKFGTPAQTVSSVMISGVNEPSYGAAVTTSGIKATAGFTITDSYWSKKNSSGNYAKTTDTTFQRDGEYSLYISGKIASGYVAADTLSVTIGTRKATVQKNGANYSAYYRYAKVTQNVWVTFDPDGGTLGAAEKMKVVTVGSTYGALPTPTKSGMSFDGWYDGSTKITSTSKVTRTADHTLKAHWKAKTPTTVTVTFDPNGGTMALSEQTKTVTVGGSYGSLPVPTRDGYTFEGWFNAANNQITADKTVTVSSNHTLTAKWKKIEVQTVTVKFDPNGGTMLLSESVRTVTVGAAYGTLPVPVRSGYSFLGWFDGDTLISATTTVSKTTDHTLKARWESNTAPHTEHTYDEGKVTKEATCTATGEMTYTCTVCGSTKTETIPMTAHTYGDAVVTKKATCTATGEQSFTCTACGSSYTEVIPKADHAFVEETTPATLKKSGEVTGTCSVCGETEVLRVIYRPKTYTLSQNKFTYNGKAKTPSVTVTDAKGEIIDPENYTVTYSNNKQIGAGKVKIAFSGDYSGTKTVKFKILPKKTAIKKLTAGNQAFKATWKQIKTGDGYQIQYATNSKFKSAKTISINDASVTAKTVKKLLSEKTYFIRIRTSKVVGTKTYYSDWSKTYKIKTK